MVATLHDNCEISVGYPIKGASQRIGDWWKHSAILRPSTPIVAGSILGALATVIAERIFR
jgi:hypothetical protein